MTAQPDQTSEPSNASFDPLIREATHRMLEEMSEKAETVGVERMGENKYMRPALRSALWNLVGPALHAGEPRLHFAHWQGPAEVRLGGVDVGLRRSDEYGWSVLMELKWGDLDWAILDVLKMTTARASPGADSCYTVVGQTLKTWESGNPVADLFDSRDWETAAVLERCWKQFTSMGKGREHGKLTGLPPRIATLLVTDEVAPPPLDSWQVKAIRIEPLPLDDSNWLMIEDGLAVTQRSR